MEGGTPKRAARTTVAAGDVFADLPAPTLPAIDGTYDILVTGIGGTGVITIGALLVMAAHLEDKGCSALDFTGLAQKNGAVMSHVRIAQKPDDIAAVRIAAGGADLVLGCDVVVAASTPALTRTQRGVTRAVINADLQPTASFVINPDMDFEQNTMQDAIRTAVGDKLDILDATGLATALLGDSIATNAFLLGFAFQKGALPLSEEAIRRAIELNNVSIEMNTQAFQWGRLAAHDRARVASAAQFRARPTQPVRRLDDAIADRVSRLTAYQNEVYAARYKALVDAVRAAETAALPSSQALTEAVARNFYKLMAYKDEYEVARLYTDGSFAQRVAQAFDGDVRLSFHLAPPLFAKRDPVTGRLIKQEFGPWMMRAFRLLARLKGLRGTTFDPFGRTAERRAERALIDDYERMMRGRLKGLTAPRLAGLVKLAAVPDMIRGYGHVKEQAMAKAAAERARLEAELDDAAYAVAAE